MSKPNIGLSVGRPSATATSKAAAMKEVAQTTRTVRINFDAPEEQRDALKRIAIDRKVPLADIMRHAIGLVINGKDGWITPDGE